MAPKGRGKTYLTCNDLIPRYERVAVFDMLHEAGYGACCNEIIVGNPKAFAEAIRKNEFKIAYRPKRFFAEKKGDDYAIELEPFIKCCYLRADCTMVIDESHQVCNPHSVPPSLLYAVRLGRHRRLNQIYITQSFSAVARPITQNADEFYFYKIIEPADIDGIYQRCGKQIAENVESLRAIERDEKGNLIRPGEILHWSTYNGIEKDSRIAGVQQETKEEKTEDATMERNDPQRSRRLQFGSDS